MGFPSYILANVVDSELAMERGWREITPACPRCGSSNTKFCYYNNYSLTQPRYFCKGCRRYWTKGGSLRNVPVGGGCRKSRRSRSSIIRHAPPSNPNGVTSSRFGSSHHHNHPYHQMNNNNMCEGDSNTSPMSSEAPTIDLAVVYANFLTQKPENSNDVHPNNSGYNHNPPLLELSSIPDATTIAPTSQVQQEQFSLPLPTIMPELMNNNNNNIEHHQNNHVLFVTDFSRPIHHHQHLHSDDHDGVLGLPPLPGESSLMLQDRHHHHHHHHHHHQPVPPWEEASNMNHHHNNNDLEMPIGLQDLESDTQFSNLFSNGSWSPLNLPGFETSTSSSKL